MVGLSEGKKGKDLVILLTLFV